jgi:hypothetical protein
MSKLARTLVLGATLVAINLTGAVAQAQSNDESTSTQDARRPPSQGQVGEPWRHHQVTSPAQAAADTAHRRQTAQEPSYNPRTTPAQAPAPVPDEPSRPTGWLLASAGVLVATLALAGGLAVRAVRRTRRGARLEHAA